MPKNFSLYLILCLSLLLPACSNPIQRANNIANKPDLIEKETKSYILPELDHGLIQSPINIYSFNEEAKDTHEITFHFQDKIKEVKNLGHSVQLDFAEGSTISYKGLTYNFKQIHFHTPSEHLIDGITFPMEMHIVTNVPAKDENDSSHYLVIAVLFKMSQAKNKFIDEFLNLIPQTEQTTAPLNPGTVKLRNAFSGGQQKDKENYYHYRGSLTTPPYTETVEWFVFKSILEASPEQIKAISAIEGNNARHIQGIFGRSID
jgi:carbonic anhydrase